MKAKQNKAFSLPEMMVALGMMGIVALGTMQLTKNATQSQKRFEASSEGQALFHTLNQGLLDSEACLNTLEAASSIANGTQITEIRNRKNNMVFNTNDVYGNRAVKIDSITVADLSTHADGFSEFNLVVTLRRMSSEISQGAKFVTHKIPIQAEIKNGRVERCYAHTDNAVASAKVEACKNIGGEYNKTNDVCDLSDNNERSEVARHIAASTKLVEENYVNIKGDEMMGDLKVKGAKICIDGNCRSFKDSCNVGEVLEKINPDGKPVCRRLLCDSTKFFNGIDSNGQPICKALPTKNCPTNQFIKQVNPDGTVVCENLPFQWGINCGQGEYIESIAANGTPVCKTAKDLIPDMDCPSGQFAIKMKDGKLLCKPLGEYLASVAALCPEGEVLKGFSSNGFANCVSPMQEGKPCVAGSMINNSKEGWNPVSSSSNITVPHLTSLGTNLGYRGICYDGKVIVTGFNSDTQKDQNPKGYGPGN